MQEITEKLESIRQALSHPERPIVFNKEFSKRFEDCFVKGDAVLKAATELDKTIIVPLSERAVKAGEKLASIGEITESSSKAKIKASGKLKAVYEKAVGDLDAFVGGKDIEGVTVKASDGLKTAAKEFETSANKVIGPTTGMFGTVRTQKDGFVAALKQNGEKMNFWKPKLELAERGKAFAHGSAVVGSAVLIGDAMFRSKTSDGEDRAATTRILQAVAGGLVGTAALIGGPAMAR